MLSSCWLVSAGDAPIRQYFPKGTDLSRVTQAEPDQVGDELNGRPRRVPGCMAPSDAISQVGA